MKKPPIVIGGFSNKYNNLMNTNLQHRKVAIFLAELQLFSTWVAKCPTRGWVLAAIFLGKWGTLDKYCIFIRYIQCVMTVAKKSIGVVVLLIGAWLFYDKRYIVEALWEHKIGVDVTKLLLPLALIGSGIYWTFFAKDKGKAQKEKNNDGNDGLTSV
jgi:hypothetical protein